MPLDDKTSDVAGDPALTRSSLCLTHSRASELHFSYIEQFRQVAHVTVFLALITKGCKA